MKLTAADRRAIPANEFALPGGHYPIEDQNHAQAALSMGAQHASPAELATIRAKVHQRFPNMDLAGMMAAHRLHAGPR